MRRDENHGKRERIKKGENESFEKSNKGKATAKPQRKPPVHLSELGRICVSEVSYRQERLPAQRVDQQPGLVLGVVVAVELFHPDLQRFDSLKNLAETNR